MVQQLKSNILFEPDVKMPRSFATSVFISPHDVIHKKTLVFKIDPSGSGTMLPDGLSAKEYVNDNTI